MYKPFHKNKYILPLIMMVIIIVVFFIILEISNMNISSKSPNSLQNINKEDSINKSTTQNIFDKWILSTNPSNGETNIPSNTDITIVFKQEMDQSTLTSENIHILDGKHNDRIISDLFNYNYNSNTKTLNIKFKRKESNFGSSNGITIILSSKISNINGISLESDLSFGFQTK